MCPNGMKGSGYGPAGCSNIDSCADYPCDDIATGCIDLEPPEHGFICVCPAGTVGQGEGNSKCAGKWT